VVGAIRWDAWHGPDSEVGLTVEKTLSPRHYHHRLPFYAKVVGESSIEVRGNTQEIMDQEIEFAHQAGLGYWAFVVYPEEHALSDGLKLYLSSEKKHKIRFCLNLQGGWEGRGGMDAWTERLTRYVKLFLEPTYQTVLDNRPLVYLYTVEGLVGPGCFETWKEARIAFDRLRTACVKAELGDPYIVAQGWSPETLKDQTLQLGWNAMGAYASSAGDEAAPYERLVAHTEKMWDVFRETGVPVVPLVTAGWDMRPRVETPVPWVKGGSILKYYEAPRPDELRDHVRRAMDWCLQHPGVVEARSILIYAWNEFDEGGWICPTHHEGSARLDAIAQVLRSGRQDGF